ncbi:class E sortase [Embleya scabrispora]|uniref:class E sortase n=1 Tax=Embleya scabrispora TaxID=159449 RepID=UPI00036E788A|nr:class E sortase [Embleya scabrispora]MYS79786.1 class E sortase [Streptomyces sp. SID5474]
MGVVRKTIRVGAELLLTLGLVGLLLCVHQLYWTNFEAEAAARSEVEQLRKDWAKHPGAAESEATESGPPAALPPSDVLDGPTDVSVDGGKDGQKVQGSHSIRGETLAILWIPRLGSDWFRPIIEGSSLASLSKGVGHYTYPPYIGPGGAGNFGVAGHRNGHGEPFRYLNKLKAGDKVVVETKSQWFTYTIVKGPFITKPSNGSVLTARPPDLGGPAGRRLITLTTCDPEFTSRNRMIYWGELTSTDAKQGNKKPAALRD